MTLTHCVKLLSSLSASENAPRACKVKKKKKVLQL